MIWPAGNQQPRTQSGLSCDGQKPNRTIIYYLLGCINKRLGLKKRSQVTLLYGMQEFKWHNFLEIILYKYFIAFITKHLNICQIFKKRLYFFVFSYALHCVSFLSVLGTLLPAVSKSKLMWKTIRRHLTELSPLSQVTASWAAVGMCPIRAIS